MKRSSWQALLACFLAFSFIASASGQARLWAGAAWGGGSVVPGFYPSTHWVPAQLPMTVIFPRPDSETTSYARPHWAFCDNSHAVQDVIPIVVQGGAYPYVFQLLSGPPGASIAQTYWVPGDTPAQMYALGYGNFVWTPQGNVTCPWTGTVSVLVTGQDLSTITVSFTLSTASTYSSTSTSGNVTVNGTTTMTLNSGAPFTYGTVLSGLADIPTGDYVVGVSGSTYTLARAATGSQTGSATGTLKSGFLFIDSTCSSCDTSGSGTITSPWQTLAKIYGSTWPQTTYPGAILYLRGNNPSTDYEAYEQKLGGPGPGIIVSGAHNPISIVGMPGDPNQPDIDITNLDASVDKDAVFFDFNDASDAFYQNLAFSGQPTTTTNHFSYIQETYGNNRLTFDNLSVPNAWSGTSSASGNSTTIEFDLQGSFSMRDYVVIRGVSESNRLTGLQNVGLYDAYEVQYAVAEFDTFAGSSTSGDGYAFGRKDTDNYWTDRYNTVSGGTQWIFWQAGFQTTGAPANNVFEDCYNTVTFNGTANPTTPGFIYNQSAAQLTTNTYAYRNSVIGTGMGVAQSSITGNGPFWFSSNAVQYGTGLAQGVTFSTIGSGSYTGGTPPSNVTLATPTSDAICQAASGIFSGTLLTGTCASSYLGQVGAQIQ